MRVLLVALNAKYVHTNLALRYLRSAVQPCYPDVSLLEFSINDRLDRIAEEIYEAKAEVVGFSCYIWNLQEIGALVRRLRPVCPDVKFVVGGPEVSFESEEFLLTYPEVDALVIGEGEEAFLALLTAWERGGDLASVPGLVWNSAGKIRHSAVQPALADLNALRDPYTEKEDLTGRLVYVETTRGCPFRCQFCLSSTSQGVRFLEPERFRPLFRRLLEWGARTIKFVDRTFNAHKRHAFKILDIVREESAYLLHTACPVRIHCEMAGDLFDAEWLAYLQGYPRGLIQLELGVQSTNKPTLDLVSRSQDFGEWKKYLPEMLEAGIPLHLDLIAGLPAENWGNFRQSFNDVYSVKPPKLQLGFLKVLKGSGLRLESAAHGLIYTPDPPYMILETPNLSHGEILQLHRLEKLLDIYYNSGKFAHVLAQAEQLFPTPFDFYHEFAVFLRGCGWFRQPGHGKVLFDVLWDFLEKTLESTKPGARSPDAAVPASQDKILDALRFDYYLWERPHVLPGYLQADAKGESREMLGGKTEREAIRDDAYWGTVIPEFQHIERRRWRRNTAVAYFRTDVLQPETLTHPCWYLFYYQQGRVNAYRFQEEWRAAE